MTKNHFKIIYFFFIDLPICKPDGTVVMKNATLAVSEIGGKRYYTACLTDAKSSVMVPLLEQERQVLNDLLVPAIIIDTKGIIQVFNKSATKAFGYELAEMIGKNVSSLMFEEVKVAHDGYLSRHMATGESKIIGVGRAVQVKAKDGQAVDCKLFITKKSEGTQTFFVGVLQLKE